MGLGLVGLGSSDINLYETLKNILFTNSATTGEAAGISIGKFFQKLNMKFSCFFL